MYTYACKTRQRHCTFTHARAGTHTDTHTHAHTHMHTHVGTHSQTHLQAREHTYRQMYILAKLTYVCARALLCVHSCMRASPLAHEHKCAHTHTHTTCAGWSGWCVLQCVRCRWWQMISASPKLYPQTNKQTHTYNTCTGWSGWCVLQCVQCRWWQTTSASLRPRKLEGALW